MSYHTNMQLSYKILTFNQLTPTMRTPLHGRRIPLKKSGIHIGSTTASSSSLLASCKSAISSQCVLGSFCTISRSNISMRSRSMPLESNRFSSGDSSSSSSPTAALPDLSLLSVVDLSSLRLAFPPSNNMSSITNMGNVIKCNEVKKF